ncbi:MAG: hypothetical protein QOD90_5621 [Mycobacterium sp.]|jgi:hypothetical protein|nr:hypothetical protein [Mycobacterium sp.]
MDLVLINRATAAGIADGTITLVLRSWDVPRAKRGGTQRTPAGTIRIDDVTEYPSGHRVTAAQARAAGYPDAATARSDLASRPAKHLYAIAVSYLAPDERPDLAADDALTADDRALITKRLDRWDAASKTGPWTRQYLRLVEANEAIRAPDLAVTVGLETAPFKRRVRQLKGLGLTISLDVGYRISPRGRAFLSGPGATVRES